MNTANWSTVRYWSLLAFLLLGFPACKKEPPAPPPQQEVLLNVATVDLQGKPVESVRFYINNKKFGITDQEGKFAGKYAAKNGDTLTFNVEAPDGYSVPPNPDQSRWQVKIQYPADGRPLQIDFRAELQRPERDFLLMVRAEPEGTPIKVNDVAVGKTGPGGDALIKVSGVPGAQFVAQAGAAMFKGTFSEDDEVYLLTAARTGPVADGAAGAAPPPAPATEVAAAPATAPAAEAAVPTPAEPVAVAQPARAQEDPWAAQPAVAQNSRQAAPAEPRGTVDFVPDPVAEEPPPVRAAPVVAAAPTPPPAREVEPSINDLLPDEPAQAPPPVVAEAPRAPKPPKEPENLGGLMNDGGETVDRNAAQRGGVVTASGPSAATMSREEIDGKLTEIQSRLGQSKVLTRADVDFLGQIDRTHPGYYEAHRLLADYHHKNKDFKRQAEELEVATASGKYKRDPTMLLSLAKSYAKSNKYGKALSTMQRVEENMRNLPAELKADSYKFFAEMYEFEFQRQYNDDAKKANVSLIDKAIHQWERYATFARGSDPGGVSAAEAKIKKLEEQKNGLEL